MSVCLSGFPDFRISDFGFRISVNTITLFTDVVESSLMSQNVGIPNTKKWFEDESNRSYRFGVTSVQIYYGRNFQVAPRELVSSLKL